MALSFSTEGRVAFRVVIAPTQVPLGRFANAVFRTNARVSHVERLSAKKWQAVVWLRTTKVPQFENLCVPMEFEFLSVRELARNVVEDEPTPEE